MKICEDKKKEYTNILGYETHSIDRLLCGELKYEITVECEYLTFFKRRLKTDSCKVERKIEKILLTQDNLLELRLDDDDKKSKKQINEEILRANKLIEENYLEIEENVNKATTFVKNPYYKNKIDTYYYKDFEDLAKNHTRLKTFFATKNINTLEQQIDYIRSHIYEEVK